MKKLILLLVLYPFLCNSQGLTNRWYLGYGGLTNTYNFSGTNLQFINDSLAITRKNRKMWSSVANASICDRQGNLLFYTNGKWIADASEDTMLNGSRLHAGVASSSPYNPSGRAAIIIPFPGDSNKYYLFHSWVDGSNNYTYFPCKGYFSVIDMSLNNGLGAVTSKNNIAFNDTMAEFGLIAACKHANGRDWWLVAPKYRSNQYQVLLITPSGIQSMPNQTIGLPPSGWYQGFAQCCFSPDGKKFGRFDGIDFLNIYDFDRCSGIFSNPVHIAFPDTMDSGGLAFSANSSKLYISDLTYLYQFNLDSVNIAATLDTVAIYDNFVDSVGYPTLFHSQQLGPDGKIYIASITSTPYLHVIDSPDSAGVACNVIQHGVALKTFNIRSLPLHPNYFLGADSGSVCDTLQLRIKNHVTRNAKIEISVYPNPLQDALHISYTPTAKTKLLEIYTIDGKFILQRKLPPWSQLQTIDVSALTNGVYICKLIDENRYSTAQFVIQGFK